MARIALVLGIAVCLLGAIGIFSPTTLFDIGRAFASPAGLLAAGAIRVVFGAVLIFAAPATRAPRTLRVVGVVIVVAGLITPFFGVDRARAILDWWSSQGAALSRIFPAVILALGGILIYLLAPRRGAV
jgi:hypothetical protein